VTPAAARPPAAVTAPLPSEPDSAPVTAYLGKLVEQELRRHARTNLGEIPTDDPPRDEAIAALDDVRRSIDELDDVAGRLARAAIAHGGTWSDVGSSLRLRADVAESAYGRPPG
jgi:hypothetical protein